MVVMIALPIVPAQGAPRSRSQGPTLTTLPRPEANLEGFGYAVAISATLPSW